MLPGSRVIFDIIDVKPVSCYNHPVFMYIGKEGRAPCSALLMIITRVRPYGKQGRGPLGGVLSFHEL